MNFVLPYGLYALSGASSVSGMISEGAYTVAEELKTMFLQLYSDIISHKKIVLIKLLP